MMIEVDLSIIVVNYMKYEMTMNCVASIEKYLKKLNYEIIIVDNKSPNDSYEKLKNEYKTKKHIIVERTEKNNGFGFGNNFGIQFSKSNFILFLNPDIILFDDSIKIMLNEFKETPNIGIIGAQLLNGDYSLQYSCRTFLEFHEFILSRTPLKKIISKKKLLEYTEKYLMKNITHDCIQDVDWLMGSCLLVRKDEFVRIGKFSEEYFMYFEDVDLCFKYKEKGLRVTYFPKCKMIHLHEQESVKKINKLTFIHIDSMFKFYKKYRRRVL